MERSALGRLRVDAWATLSGPVRMQGAVTCNLLQLVAATDPTHYYYPGQYLESSRAFGVKSIT